MIKKFVLIVSILFTVVTYAQETTSSPYSFYGIGLLKFKGTVENQGMGGMSIYSDSIHLNLKNPAAYGDLELTTYTLGAMHREIDLSSTGGSENTSSTSIDYLAIGIPAGKFGFGVGLMPYSSVGYKLQEETSDFINRFTGRGGINRVYFSAGYEISENLRIGAETHYNFGNIQNSSIFIQNEIQYSTREDNRSDIYGFSFNFGLNYKRMLTEELEMQASAYYTPSASLTSENSRQVSTVAFTSAGQDVPVDERDVEIADTDLTLPSQYNVGLGVGRNNNWFVGLEYGQMQASSFSNRSFNVADVRYEDASSYRIGGFWVPKYNSLTSYFKRLTYRTGFRYEETGLVKANQAINEFGISFGVGFPVGQWFSNANIGVEYGQRGTTAAGLVKEEFFNVSLSLSLNDRWFVKTKYD